MLTHRFPKAFLADVNAELLLQRVQKLTFNLLNIESQAVIADFHRRIYDAVGEIRIFDQIQFVHIFHHAHHLLTGVGRGVEVQKVEPTFKRPFKEGPGIAADEAAHVVLADVQRTGIRHAEPDGERSPAVQQNLRHIIAGIACGHAALCLCLLYQLVICMLQQFFIEPNVF